MRFGPRPSIYTAMRKLVTYSRFLACSVLFGSLLTASAAQNPFLGDWELTIPGGNAGWLGVEASGGALRASMLWGWGSVEPCASAQATDGKLVLTRLHPIERKQADGKTLKTNITETITATLDGDTIRLTSSKPRENGQGIETDQFSGRRQPSMPPAPDLAALKYGPATQLFNGKDLGGWRLTDPNAVNGWSVKDGILVNNPAQEEGKPHKNYGNLRTDAEFGDFTLELETRLGQGGNSGIYLRGIYEIQVTDSYGKPLDSHNMGALYSRIKPTVNAEKPAGEWQTMRITLAHRHITVVLNGKTIIDNQPARGCTGGALWSDVSRPGPIYFQGDHTGIEYRNIVLRPIL